MRVVVLIEREFIVARAQAGVAIDILLTRMISTLSRRKVKRLIDQGCVKVDGRRVWKASLAVSASSVIKLRYSEDVLKVVNEKTFSLSAADILFDRCDLVAINKPPLLPSQAPRSTSMPHVLTVMQQYKSEPYYLCHRLDKETSGVLLLAKTKQQVEWITNQFRERKVKKKYLAIVPGKAGQRQWSVINYLSPIDKKSGKVTPVQSGGKYAKTEFRVLNYNPKLDVSLIECRPHTGRSHQIRVHLLESKLPIVGDKKYGNAFRHKDKKLESLSLAHHFLHAYELELIPHQDESSSVLIKAGMPPNFQEFVDYSALF